MSLVEIKGFNTLINSEPFFDQSMKNKQKVYGRLAGMWRNDDYTTGILWDTLYHQEYYKLFDIDLSRQINMTIPQQIKFMGN